MTIEEIEQWVGQPLPDPYRGFLEAQKDGVLVNDLVLLYGRMDFAERNESVRAKERCPGHVAVGDDSGDSRFMLALHDGRLFSVDAGAMMLEYFHPVADDFAAWLSAGCRFEGDDG